MKNQNGMGSIINLGKHRRKPWAVRVTDGWVEGKQIYRYIGYYEKRQDAQTALASWQIHPTPAKSDMTLDAVYNEWKETHFSKISKQMQDNYTAAYAHIQKLHDKKIKDIRTAEMQRIIDSLDRSASTKQKIKALLSKLFAYSMQNDIVQKDYSQYVTIQKSEKAEKEIFTDAEIKALEDHDTIPWVDSILVLIYTGMRIQELLNLTVFDVDFENGIIRGGVKTEAGKNRVIPIHPKIRKYLEARCEGRSGVLYKIDQSNYRNRVYYPLLEQLGIQRRSPHCTRHTCASLMVRDGVDPVAIKQILGHTKYSFTVDTYTHVNLDFLKNEFSKVDA